MAGRVPGVGLRAAAGSIASSSTIGGLVESGEVQLSTCADALDTVPSGGIAYLPTASYREMEGWSLPPDAHLRLIRLERTWGGADRGPGWRAHPRRPLAQLPGQVLRVQPDAQEDAGALALCRRRGDPPAARRAIGRAQCNDAYWHGVFGGLYLPHLREAIWQNLARAEAELRRGEALASRCWTWMATDTTRSGSIPTSSRPVLSPRRGGAVEEYTIFARRINYANTLTRRREAYHDTALEQHAESNAGADGVRPAFTTSRRAFAWNIAPRWMRSSGRSCSIGCCRGLTLEQYAVGDYRPARSWAQLGCSFTIERQHDTIAIVCTFGGDASLEKRLEFSVDGSVTVRYRWDPSVGQPDDFFAPELSLFAPLEIKTQPSAEIWTFPIETVAKSERGLDRTRQGNSVTLRWPVRLGEARLELTPAPLGQEQELQAANIQTG